MADNDRILWDEIPKEEREMLMKKVEETDTFKKMMESDDFKTFQREFGGNRKSTDVKAGVIIGIGVFAAFVAFSYYVTSKTPNPSSK